MLSSCWRLTEATPEWMSIAAMLSQNRGWPWCRGAMRLQKVTLLWTCEDERQENLKTKRPKTKNKENEKESINWEVQKEKRGKTRQELQMSRSSWRRSSFGKLPLSHYFDSSPHWMQREKYRAHPKKVDVLVRSLNVAISKQISNPKPLTKKEK